MHLCIRPQEHRSPEKPCHVGLTTARPTNTCSQPSKLTLEILDEREEVVATVLKTLYVRRKRGA